MANPIPRMIYRALMKSKSEDEIVHELTRMNTNEFILIRVHSCQFVDILFLIGVKSHRR